MRYLSTHVLGYDVFADDIMKIEIKDDRKMIINTINAHSYVLAKKDRLFRSALKKSDVLVPDGSAIVLASTYHNSDHISKIAGSDIHIHLLELLERKGGRCFYLGSSSQTLQKIEERVNNEYANIEVATYSPPFTKDFSDEENAEMVKRINEFKPDVLFLGMTAPKQEKWLYQHKDQLDVKVMTPIGAVFDFYSATIIRPSQFWIDWHLEWLPRFVQEPRRLWRRNLISSPIFVLDALHYKRFALKES